MAAAMPETNFVTWISTKLQSLNVDDEVFGTYIIGILDEEDTSREEKNEAIAGILEEVENESMEEICSDILNQWDQHHHQTAAADSPEPCNESSKSEVTMSSIMEKHAAAVVKKEPTKDQKADKADKAAILAMYAQVSEDEDDDDIREEAATGSSAGFEIEKNTNADHVLKAQKEQRDKARQDHEKKKEQDKEQRAKDKQKAQDRKEREKKRTQKQERKR